MRKVQLFIATSIDGYIATDDGSISWLFTDADYGYDAFYAQVDTVLIGRKTYEQVLELGEWPYSGRVAYVFSKNAAQLTTPEGISLVTFTSRSPSDVVRELLEKPGKNIWVVGGAGVTGNLLASGLVDEMVLSVHPIVLGQGIPLASAYTQAGPKFDYWQLVSTQSYSSGLVQLSYTKKHDADQASTSAAPPASQATAEQPATEPQPPAPSEPSPAPTAEPAEPKTPTAAPDSPAPTARDTPKTDQGPSVAADSPP